MNPNMAGSYNRTAREGGSSVIDFPIGQSFGEPQGLTRGMDDCMGLDTKEFFTEHGLPFSPQTRKISRKISVDK
jgi:hypothetical protein